jgi:alkylated DNA repair dioxygenase AlkB
VHCFLIKSASLGFPASPGARRTQARLWEARQQVVPGVAFGLSRVPLCRYSATRPGKRAHVFRGAKLSWHKSKDSIKWTELRNHPVWPIPVSARSFASDHLHLTPLSQLVQTNFSVH